MIQNSIRTVRVAAKYVDMIPTHSYSQYKEGLNKRKEILERDLEIVIGKDRIVPPEDDCYWYQQSLKKEIRLIHNLVYRLSLARAHGHGN